jgi:hypothetical protein
MTGTDDTQRDGGSRGRPVIKRIDEPSLERVRQLIETGKLWMFCGEYDEQFEIKAIDAAERQHGGGIYQSFDRGSWGRGHWRA